MARIFAEISNEMLSTVSGGDNASQTGSNSATSTNTANSDQTNVVLFSRLGAGAGVGGSAVSQSSSVNQTLSQRLQQRNTRVRIF